MCERHSHTHLHPTPSIGRVPVVQNVFGRNDCAATENRAHLDDRHGFGFTFMSSPGTEKAALLATSIAALKIRYAIGAIEVFAQVDAERITTSGVSVVQKNTAGGFDVEAFLAHAVLHAPPLSSLRVLCHEKCRQYHIPYLRWVTNHA